MKSYTDIEQSKFLSKILPIESADMWHHGFFNPSRMCKIHYNPPAPYHSATHQWDCPCWSLAALLIILAKIANKIDDDGSANLSSFMGQWRINMFDCPVEASDNYDNPVDACVAMIEKLYELKML